MDYKSITVFVTDAETDGTAVEAALAFSRRHDSHLDIICLGIDPARYEAMPAGTVAMALDTGAKEAQEDAEALAGWVRRTIGEGHPRCAVEATTLTLLGIDPGIARMARYADLVIAGQAYGPERLQVHAMIVEAALFGTSAPVLIVPDGRAQAAAVAGDPVRPLVAWNETDEALGAVRRALPLLRAASHVDVVMVDPAPHSAERSDPGGALAVMLSRHGVRAEVSIVARTLPAVSEVIRRYAADHGNDLIVMGAYGHSRFREALFGGATREMLNAPELPVMMAH